MTITCGRGRGWHKDIGKHYNEGLLVFVQPLPLFMSDGLPSLAENVHRLAASTHSEGVFPYHYDQPITQGLISSWPADL